MLLPFSKRGIDADTHICDKERLVLYIESEKSGKMVYDSKSDLGRLFDERYLSEEVYFSQTSEFQDILELRDTAEEELREQLSAGAADLFGAYKDYSGKITEQKCRECWIQGMAQGVRMTAEAFLTGDR